jgi:signal transduction histidine kinase
MARAGHQVGPGVIALTRAALLAIGASEREAAVASEFGLSEPLSTTEVLTFRYRTYINRCEWDEAERTWLELPPTALGPLDSPITIALAYVVAGRLADAARVMRRLMEKGPKPRLREISALVFGLRKSGQIDEFRVWLEELRVAFSHAVANGERLDDGDFRGLLTAYALDSNPFPAETIVDQYTAAGNPHLPRYAALLALANARSSPTRTIEFLRKALAQGYQPEPSEICNLALTLLDSGAAGQALEAVGALSGSLVTIAELPTDRGKQTVAVLRALFNQGVRLSHRREWTQAVLVVIRAGCPTEAESLLLSMRNTDAAIDAILIHEPIMEMARAGDSVKTGAALGLLKALGAALDGHFYAAHLEALARNQNLQEMEFVIGRMQADGVPLTAHHFTPLIKVCAARGNVELAESFLARAAGLRIDIDAPIRAVLLRAYARAGDVAQARRLLAELVRDGAVRQNFAAVLPPLARRGDVSDLVEVVGQMLSHGMAINERESADIVEALAARGADVLSELVDRCGQALALASDHPGIRAWAKLAHRGLCAMYQRHAPENFFPAATRIFAVLQASTEPRDKIFELLVGARSAAMLELIAAYCRQVTRVFEPLTRTSRPEIVRQTLDELTPLLLDAPDAAVVPASFGAFDAVQARWVLHEEVRRLRAAWISATDDGSTIRAVANCGPARVSHRSWLVARHEMLQFLDHYLEPMDGQWHLNIVFDGRRLRAEVRKAATFGSRRRVPSRRWKIRAQTNVMVDAPQELPPTLLPLRAFVGYLDGEATRIYRERETRESFYSGAQARFTLGWVAMRSRPPPADWAKLLGHLLDVASSEAYGWLLLPSTAGHAHPRAVVHELKNHLREAIVERDNQALLQDVRRDVIRLVSNVQSNAAFDLGVRRDTRVDLQQLTRDLLANRAGLLMRITVEAGDEVDVSGDAAVIRLGISNLVDNAVHAASQLGSAGEITIRIALRDDRCIFFIRNNCPGIGDTGIAPYSTGVGLPAARTMFEACDANMRVFDEREQGRFAVEVAFRGRTPDEEVVHASAARPDRR